MALFARQSHTATVIVLVLSDSVAIAAVRGGATPHILHAALNSLPPGERSPEQRSTLLIGTLKDTCIAFAGGYGKTPHAKDTPLANVEIHLGAAHVEAATASHTIALPDQTTITDAHIADAAAKALASLPATPRETLESNVIRVHVNGYPTANPKGKSGRHMMATVFRSTIEASQKRAVADAVATAFPGRTPTFRSFARDLMFVIREHIPVRDQLVVSIEGEATHLLSLRGDDIAAHQSIPLGVSTLMTKMTGEGSPEETRTLVRLAAKDACSTAACEGIKAKLASVEPLLVKTCGDGFAALSQVYRLPNASLILADDDVQPWFEAVFSRLDFAQFTVTSQPLAVTPLHRALRGIVTADVPTTPWIEAAAAASALYTNTV